MSSTAQGSVVVTGGAGGIGTAVVERLLAAGTAVVATDLDEGRLGRLRERLSDGRLRTVAGDAGDETVAARCLAAAEELAPLTGWVNNTARFLVGALDTTSVEELMAAVDGNLRPAVVGARAAVQHLLAHAREGCVVNISSLQASRVLPGNVGYSMAKAATEALTRNIGVEYGTRGIRSVAIAPGTIRIPGYWAELESATPAHRARLEAWNAGHHPVGRPGDPQEVADTVLYALGNRFLNATVIALDGGWTADAKVGTPPLAEEGPAAPR